jgi:hypothetical protein
LGNCRVIDPLGSENAPHRGGALTAQALARTGYVGLGRRTGGGLVARLPPLSSGGSTILSQPSALERSSR